MKNNNVTRKDVLIWAEIQRQQYAAGNLSISHFNALNAVPGWSWELTTNKVLADACGSNVEHEGVTCDKYID
jgi:hypothetical protein